MADGKRYYWLKLQDGFFHSKRIKKLRSIAGGDTYTIIYLKMQLVAMKHNGILEYTGLEDSFERELALDIDEDATNVGVTVDFLLRCGLMETSDEREYYLPYAVENTGSEGATAQRQREYRTRVRDLTATPPLLGCDNVTSMSHLCDGEIEKELEIESDKSKSKKKKSFSPPTLEEVSTYCLERKNKVNAQHFIDYYAARDWMLGKTKMKDWKAAVRTWESRERNEFNNGQSVHGNTASGAGESQSEWNLDRCC